MIFILKGWQKHVSHQHIFFSRGPCYLLPQHRQ